jgi:hypothetical protein
MHHKITLSMVHLMYSLPQIVIVRASTHFFKKTRIDVLTILIKNRGSNYY